VGIQKKNVPKDARLPRRFAMTEGGEGEKDELPPAREWQ